MFKTKTTGQAVDETMGSTDVYHYKAGDGKQFATYCLTRGFLREHYSDKVADRLSDNDMKECAGCLTDFFESLPDWELHADILSAVFHIKVRR